jgi:hypothetical protein
MAHDYREDLGGRGLARLADTHGRLNLGDEVTEPAEVANTGGKKDWRYVAGPGTIVP